MLVELIFNESLPDVRESPTHVIDIDEEWKAVASLAGPDGRDWRRWLQRETMSRPVMLHAELRQQPSGRLAVGSIGSCAVTDQLIATMHDRQIMIDERVVDAFFQMISARPGFFRHSRNVAVVAASSFFEWDPKVLASGGSVVPITVPDAFSPHHATWVLNEARMIMHPHCEDQHWTLYIAELNSDNSGGDIMFFDPFADQGYRGSSDPRHETIRSFTRFVRDIVVRDPSNSNPFTSVSQWPIHDARRVYPHLPVQRGGLGCALHVCAFALDHLAGRHHSFSDADALRLRTVLRFLVATGTNARILV